MLRGWPIILLLFLGACSTDPLVVDAKPVEIQRYDPPMPNPVRPADIEFKVLTYETTVALNDAVEAGEELPYSYMAMTTRDYLSLAQWLQDVQRYIKQLQSVVLFYRADPEPLPAPEEAEEVEAPPEKAPPPE